MFSRPSQTGPIRPNSGFTLVEIVVVLIIVSVLISMAAAMTKGVAAAALRNTTRTRITAVDVALVNFVMMNRRLPCPANGALPSSDAQAGREQLAAGICTGNQAAGVVPWISLGLTEQEASDAWDARLTYRVAADLVVTESMNFTTCDSGGGSAAAAGTPSRCAATCTASTLPLCTQPQAAFTNRGIEIRDVAGAKVADPVVGMGSAYVLLSHGESRGGGYGQGTGLPQASVVSMGSGELQNAAANALQAFYVDDTMTDAAAPAHFDDVVSRPGVLAVAMRAGLSPRTH